MTLIMVAVDESDESIAAAKQARELFGADAAYLAVNVAQQPPTWAPSPLAWGAVYPYPFGAPYPVVDQAVTTTPTEEVADRARQTAQSLAGEAGILAAAALGEVGDRADAILDAAEIHHADVIVIGASSKSWWQRLVEGSVGKQITKRSTRPVLIAGQTADDAPTGA